MSNNPDNDPRKSLKGRIYRWGPVMLWMAVIFCLSAQPKLPDVGGWFDFDNSDKLAHAVAYAVGGALIWRALSRKSPWWWQVGATVAIAAAYGLSDESHQMLVPPRTFDMMDLVADVIGAAVAAVILTLTLGGNEIGTGTGELRSEGQETL